LIPIPCNRYLGLSNIPYEGGGVLPRARYAVAGDQLFDRAEGEVEHGVSYGLGEDVVYVDSLDTHLLIIAAHDRKAELAVVPVVGVEGDVERDSHGEVVWVVHLVGGVVFGIVDLPDWSGIHG
jgi:hypothetical protein